MGRFVWTKRRKEKLNKSWISPKPFSFLNISLCNELVGSFTKEKELLKDGPYLSKSRAKFSTFHPIFERCNWFFSIQSIYQEAENPRLPLVPRKQLLISAKFSGFQIWEWTDMKRIIVIIFKALSHLCRAGHAKKKKSKTKKQKTKHVSGEISKWKEC